MESPRRRANSETPRGRQVSEKHYKVTKLTEDTFEEVAKGVGVAYERIVRLMEEEILSNEEFEFWTEATHILVNASQQLADLAKRAD